MNIMHKTAVLAAASLLLTAAPALALDAGAAAGVGVDARVGSTTVKATVDAKLEARISKAKERANQEIDRRISALTEMNTKIQTMAKISGDTKGRVSTQISAEVSKLTALKAKVAADADLATLKTDIKSITNSYRIFMLVIPQARIQIAADKVAEVASSMTALSAKLQARIEAARASGKDTASLSASLSDMNTKVADASTQASAAAAAVATLSPDNGDKAKADANMQTMKDSRAKIQTALREIEAARKDARGIVQGLKGMGLSATSSASTSVEAR